MAELTILQAIEQICQEKKLSKETVLGAIEQALAAAYRRDYGQKNQNIKVEFNPEDGSMKVFDVKTVVEDLPEEDLAKSEVKKVEAEKLSTETLVEAEKRHFNPRTEIQLSEARKIKKSYKVGDMVITELPLPVGFGRVAAQTAKQVIIQRLREAERQTIFDRYKSQEGKIITGVIQRREKNLVLVDLPDTVALLPPSEQILEEKYNPGQKMQFYLQAVKQTTKGPEVILSRRHPEIVRELFRQEIPEIANGLVEIKAIAREAGSRTKVAVWTKEKSIDPVGACIGQRGIRIQTIIAELGGEKIDIIEWNEDPLKFVINALSPAKIQSAEIDKETKKAVIKIKEEYLSLAIGRAGQNVRLASRLTGYEIEIQTIPKETKKTEETKEEVKKTETNKTQEEEKIESKK
ncbi:MAG: transcription termination factor NusA [Patescibacteria group bacterium]